ncbi:MAG TPA: TonB-dependent receptor [Longimicrobiales bacterium]
MSLHRAVPAAILAAGLVWPGATRGQEPATDSVAPIPVRPIVITVLRAPIELREAPYAVDVVDEARLRRGRPGLGLDETLRGVPGVQIDNRYNDALGERISIRGFGARAQFGVRGIKVLVDGIPATLPDGQTTLSHVDLSALGRIEVLRGPASMLYGNAAGGVILLETDPASGAPWEAGVVAGQDGLLRLDATAAGSSADAAYLLHVARLAYDGYRDFSASEKLHATARLHWLRGDEDLRVTGHFVDYDARNPGSLSAAELEADRTAAHLSNRTQRTGERGQQGELGAIWRRPLGAHRLEASAYVVARSVDNPIPPAIIDLRRTAGGARVVFRSGTGTGARGWRWAVGADIGLQHDDRHNFENNAGARGALTLDQSEAVAALGAFANLALPLTGPLDLTAGLRYDRFRFSAADRLIAPDDPDDSGVRTMDALSPSLGLHLALGDAAHLYANATTAFATPTTTELANRPDGAGGFNPSLEPEHTFSVEAGARGRIADRVGVQFALYRAAVDDVLIPFEVASAPGRQFFRNAGSAVHRGVEAALDAELAPRFHARLAYTYTDARFSGGTAATATIDGNRIPGVAPHRIEAAIAFDDGSRYAVLEARHSADIPVDDANSAVSPGYTVLDARIGHAGFRLGRIDLAPTLGITNVTDAAYNASVTVNAFGGRYFEPGPGRAFYAALSLRLGAEP